MDPSLFYELIGLSFDGETLLGKRTAPNEQALDYNHTLALRQFMGEGDTLVGSVTSSISCHAKLPQ